MNLLFLTPQLPYPPRQGTTIRNYNLIRLLAQRHSIDLLTFLAPGEVLEADNPLHALCGRIGTVAQPARSTAQRARDTLLAAQPDMGLRLQSDEMARWVERWTGAGSPERAAYDIVQIEGIELAQYGMQCAGRKLGPKLDPKLALRPALVFDNHNAEYVLQQRSALTDLRRPRRWPAAGYSLVQWRKLRRYEAAILNAADAAMAVSTADRAAMAEIAPAARIEVASNGIDLELYRPVAAQQDAAAPKLVFTGKMDYRPNIDAVLWFAEAVLPRIVAQVPEAVFQVVGMNPHPRLDVLRGRPEVEITGAVDDTRPYIHGAAAYVIPMRVGGGTRFKALEAMACGRAIVSTGLGVEGIPVAHDRELLLADTEELFAAEVLRLIVDLRGGGALARRLGSRARAFVEAHYGWEQIVPLVERVYTEVTGKP